MTPTREELAKALDEVRTAAIYAKNLASDEHAAKLQGYVDRLKDCVVLSRHELEQVERALWGFMEAFYHYRRGSNTGAWHVGNLGWKGTPRSRTATLQAAGLIDNEGKNWTPKAHAFAERMEEQKP